MVFVPHRLAYFYWIIFWLLNFDHFFKYSWEQSSNEYVVCKYFLPVCSLSFHSVFLVFYRAQVFNFDKNNVYIKMATRYLKFLLREKLVQDNVKWFLCIRRSPLVLCKFNLHNNNENRILNYKLANCFS